MSRLKLTFRPIKVSWKIGESPKVIHGKIFAFLGSKRVLYEPCKRPNTTVCKLCAESVIEIKKSLRDILSEHPLDVKKIAVIPKMIRACNDYLERKEDYCKHDSMGVDECEWLNVPSACPLKTFRRKFKEAIDEIEVKFGLDFDDYKGE